MDIKGYVQGKSYVYELTVDLPKESSPGNYHELIKTERSGGGTATSDNQGKALERIKQAAIRWLNANSK